MSSSRDFDITWLPPVKKAPMVEKGVTRGVDPPGGSDDALIQAFGGDPEERLHVVDLAKITGLSFDEALQGVLRLVADDLLEIVKRDEMGSDHMVGRPAGEQPSTGG